MSSTLNIMESLSQTEREVICREVPAPRREPYSASHNKSQESCATHKYMELAANPGKLRKGSLIFWQLGAPNLIPGLVHHPTDGQKLRVNSILARKTARSASPAQEHARIGGSSRRRSSSVGHNFAPRTGDQDRNWDGISCFAKTCLPRAWCGLARLGCLH